MRARFLQPAEAELEEAVDYFDEQSPDLGARFEREVKATVALILDHPGIGSPLTKRVRKFRVRKFKYNVIYIPDDEEIVIVAVAHPKRRPRYWHGRLARKR